MKYAVGMFVKDNSFNLPGVIFSWDLSCKKSEEWMEKSGIRNLARGPDQPFYKIFFCDGRLYAYLPEGKLNYKF